MKVDVVLSTAIVMNKLAVVASSEFTAFIGRGPCDPATLTNDALLLGFGDIGEADNATSIFEWRLAGANRRGLSGIGRKVCLIVLGPHRDGDRKSPVGQGISTSMSRDSLMM